MAEEVLGDAVGGTTRGASACGASENLSYDEGMSCYGRSCYIHCQMETCFIYYIYIIDIINIYIYDKGGLGNSILAGGMKSSYISCIDSKMGLTVLRVQPLSVNVPFQKYEIYLRDFELWQKGVLPRY